MVTCAPIACKHKVSGSISLPSRGPFHLSLTVLYAIGHWVVFRLGGWAPRLQIGFHVSGLTLDTHCIYSISPTGLLPSVIGLSSSIRLSKPCVMCVRNPRTSSGLASFPFARRYLGNRCFFLFLRVLRCFSSPGFLLIHYYDVHVWVIGYYADRIPPFGNLRVKGYLLLTAAYRSLSRPSSAPDAKSFSLRSL